MSCRDMAAMATVEAAVLRVLRAGRLAHVLPPQAHSHSRQQLRRCRPLLATGRMQPPSSNGLELCELMSQWHDPPTRPCHWLISSHSSQPLELGGCIRSRTTYRPHPVQGGPAESWTCENFRPQNSRMSKNRAHHAMQHQKLV